MFVTLRPLSLATFKSFWAASSQPGLTRIIQQAEKRLGFELFRRGSKMVTLTPAGAEFLVFAERFLQEFSTTKDKAIRRTAQNKYFLFNVYLTCGFARGNK